MSLKDLAKQLQQAVKQGAAHGLNHAADVVLKDIQDHVQVRTGNLRDSYAVTERATPDRLSTQVSSPLARPGQYGENHYPNPVDRIPADRNRAMQAGNPLFGTDGDTEAVERLVQESVEQSIQEEVKRAGY